jgi:uncharacterized caspase-like protein
MTGRGTPRITTFVRALLAVVFCVGAVVAFSAERPAGGEKRIALVLGNDSYPKAPLQNAVSDATAIAAKLRELNFEVVVRTNVSQREMTRAVRDFGEKITPGAVALFYYAGHGMQARGKNFLIPIDAEINSESAISIEAVDVERVLDQLTGARVGMVILDACRNNPFERRFRAGAGAGLAQIDAPAGTLIAYATAPGKVALDGQGKHGTYTEALLKAMDVPGLRVEDVFKQVRIDVLKVTGSKQIPWESSSLTGDFLFRPARLNVSDRQEQRISSDEVATLRDSMAALQAQLAELRESRAKPAPAPKPAPAQTKPPVTQDTAVLREEVARLNTELTRLQQNPAAAGLAPPEHTAAWSRQLAQLSARSGRLDFGEAMEKVLDVTAPDDVAAIRRFASQLGRRGYNSALALGVDQSGLITWGGSYNFRRREDAAEAAIGYCATAGGDTCKSVAINGELVRETLVEALKPLGRQPVDVVRAAYLRSLARPEIEIATGLSDPGATASSAIRRPMGYTFDKGGK